MVACKGFGMNVSLMESGALLNCFARCNPINDGDTTSGSLHTEHVIFDTADSSWHGATTSDYILNWSDVIYHYPNFAMTSQSNYSTLALSDTSSSYCTDSYTFAYQSHTSTILCQCFPRHPALETLLLWVVFGPLAQFRHISYYIPHGHSLSWFLIRSYPVVSSCIIWYAVSVQSLPLTFLSLSFPLFPRLCRLPPRSCISTSSPLQNKQRTPLPFIIQLCDRILWSSNLPLLFGFSSGFISTSWTLRNTSRDIASYRTPSILHFIITPNIWGLSQLIHILHLHSIRRIHRRYMLIGESAM
jgi:hypothetical protein